MPSGQQSGGQNQNFRYMGPVSSWGDPSTWPDGLVTLDNLVAYFTSRLWAKNPTAPLDLIRRRARAFAQSYYASWQRQQQQKHRLPPPTLEEFFPDGLLPFESGAPVMSLEQFWQLNITEATLTPLRDHINNTLTAWVVSLPFSDEAKRLIQSAGGLLVYDWLWRVMSYEAQTKGLPMKQLSYYDEFRGEGSRGRGAYIPTAESFATYLSKLDVDALLYQLSPEVYYRNAIEGLTGLTSEERQRLAAQAYQIAQLYGQKATLGRELLLQLDPEYAFLTYVAQGGLTAEEQARLTRLYPQLFEAARQAGVGYQQFWDWLNQHPARQMLVTYDPEYAFEQFLANANLRDSERQSLRRYFDVILAQWRAQGSPGSFHTWLGARAGHTPSSQQEFLEGLDPAYAYQGWMARQTGAMSEEGRRRVEQSYDRLYNYFRDLGDQAPATFRDFLKNYQPGDVALGQAPAPLRDLVGRTRWLGY